MKIVVTDVIEHEDGSATFNFDIDSSTLKLLASQKLKEIITEAAKNISEKEFNPISDHKVNI